MHSRHLQTAIAVDDDPVVGELLHLQLTSLGFGRVHSFSSAEAATAMFPGDGGTVDLIVCDLSMPGMNGVDFIRHQRQAGYVGDVVLFTGLDQKLLDAASALVRADGVNLRGTLRKPIALEQLRALLAGPHVATELPVDTAPKSYAPERLRAAIADGELVNHYQPKVDMRTGAVVGVEALVRWEHPEDGLLAPALFIATAEASGLIDSLLVCVLENSMAQARRWRQAGLSTRMSVNISALNLKYAHLSSVISRIADAVSLPMSSLILELTETETMANQLEAADLLTRLRLLGVGLSIDDFGTGYSSLLQLNRLPFDELKLDRAFVQGASGDGARRAIVEACLTLATKLGVKTVAEGVENQQDWDYLRRVGCDFAQGFLVGHPVPGDELMGWLDGWMPRFRVLSANFAPDEPRKQRARTDQG